MNCVKNQAETQLFLWFSRTVIRLVQTVVFIPVTIWINTFFNNLLHTAIKACVSIANKKYQLITKPTLAPTIIFSNETIITTTIPLLSLLNFPSHKLFH